MYISEFYMKASFREQVIKVNDVQLEELCKRYCIYIVERMQYE